MAFHRNEGYLAWKEMEGENHDREHGKAERCSLV